MTGQIYIVNDLDLIAAIQRHPKILSFWYLEALFGKRLAGVSKAAAHKLMHNVHRDEGEISLFDDGIKFLSKVLRPGAGLDGMNQKMLETIVTSLGQSDAALGTSRELDLWKWIRHEMTMATTDATYGPANPYRDPVLENAFWDVSDDASLLLMDIFPTIIARKGYIGRAKLTEAFHRYFDNGEHRKASLMTQGRYDIVQRHEISHLDMARLESVQGVTILSNTVPSAFWVIYHVISKSEVLADARQRLFQLAEIKSRQGKSVYRLQVSRLREDAMFSSILQECLRHQSFGAVTRMVMEDIMLDGRYFLKKGSMVMMPNEAVHTNDTIWGDARIFDHQRFLRKDIKLPSGAIRTFGGGANRCPGRFFATTEICFMVAILTLKYDIQPRGGQWVLPRPDFANMSAIVTPPKDAVPVVVTVRDDWRQATWEFTV